jgi:hypothetical protein
MMMAAKAQLNCASLYAPPAIVVQPLKAVLSSSVVTLGACSPLNLNALASTGVSNSTLSSVQWSVSQSSCGALSSFTSYLNQMSSTRSVIISANSALIAVSQACNFTVLLTLRNTAGNSSSAWCVVNLVPAALPVIAAMPTDATISTMQSFTLVASAFGAPVCGSMVATNSSVRYKWSQLGGGMSVIGNATGRLLSLAPYALNPGATYVFSLTVTDIMSGGQNTAQFTLRTSSNAPRAVLQSGASIMISQLNALTLSAQGSFEPDFASNKPQQQALTYNWTCIRSVSRANCFSPSVTTSLLTRTASLQIPAGTLSNTTTSGDDYVFTVTVLSSVSGLVGNASTAVSVSFQSVYRVSISSNVIAPAFLSQSGTFRALAIVSDPSTQSLLSSNQVMAQWVCTAGCEDSLFTLASSRVRTPLNSFFLTIAPGGFVAGRTYTFQLQAWPISLGSSPASSAIGYASTQVTVAPAAPSNGICGVSPQTGTTQTSFTVTCSGWQANYLNAPALSYQLFAAQPGSTLRGVALNLVPGTSPVFTTTFPLGDASNSSTLTLNINICDEYSCFLATTSATVTASALDVASAASKIASAASDPTDLQVIILSLAGSTGSSSDIQQVQTQMVTAIGNLVNVSTSAAPTGSTAELNTNVQFIQMLQTVITSSSSSASSSTRTQMASMAGSIVARMQASLAASANSTGDMTEQQLAARQTAESTLAVFAKVLTYLPIFFFFYLSL